MESGFRKLTVWRKAQDLARDICALVDELPRKRSADILAAQVLRSALSVPANIAEGYSRFSTGAYRNHLSIARGSVMETESHVDMLLSVRLIAPDVAAAFVARCEEVGRLLTTHMKTASSSLREEGATYEV